MRPIENRSRRRLEFCLTLAVVSFLSRFVSGSDSEPLQSVTIHGVRPGYHRLALRRLGVPNSSDVYPMCLNARVESYGPNGLAPFVCMDILNNGEIFQVEGQRLEWSGGAAGYDVPRAQRLLWLHLGTFAELAEHGGVRCP